MAVLKVATCQFPVSSDIGRNARYVRDHIRAAAKRRAHVVHFPEGALSGYPGSDFDAWDGFDWDLLGAETNGVRRLAKEKRVWVILGSSHQLSPGHLPHNCLYAIDPRGRIVERYDKRFCTPRDLEYYTVGDHFSVVRIKGVTCGLLLCYDLRFPELFREYKKRGVQCLFMSFYNARARGRNIHTTIMRPTLQARAATNGFPISAANPSGYYQSWPSVFVAPDGTIAASLRQHRTGLMVNTVDTRRRFYDPSAPFRDDAMKGILQSGPPVDDPRSQDRRCGPLPPRPGRRNHA